MVEMLAVLVIVGVLASIGLPLADITHKRRQEEELRSALREIRSALDAYKKATEEGRIARIAGASGYPPNLDLLVTGVVNARSPSRERIYLLRRIPRDPFSTEVDRPASKTWGLRSYLSPPEDPREGDDVFDVYSLSTEAGMNGIPYRQW